VKTHEARTVHLPRFLRDELPDLAERLDALRARTAPLARPSGAPAVLPMAKSAGQ
jgi:hypothetical protein